MKERHALFHGLKHTLKRLRKSPGFTARGRDRSASSISRTRTRPLRGRGSISGGLTDFSSGGDYFLLDHDQRNTFSAGFDARLPQGVFAATNVSYGSGFTDSGGPEHLPGHTTVNLSVGKSFGEKMSLAITAVNVANSHLLIDNSLTFGGTHFNNPREVYGEVRYRFHY